MNEISRAFDIFFCKALQVRNIIGIYVFGEPVTQMLYSAFTLQRLIFSVRLLKTLFLLKRILGCSFKYNIFRTSFEQRINLLHVSTDHLPLQIGENACSTELIIGKQVQKGSVYSIAHSNVDSLPWVVA